MPQIIMYCCVPPPCLRSGRPVADFSLKSAPRAIRLLVRGVMLAALASFFLLPWAAMAASGSWRAGLTYFAPSMTLVSN